MIKDDCYELWLSDSATCVGWILRWIVERMPWTDGEWTIDRQARKITPRAVFRTSANQRFSSENEIIARLMERARDQKIFASLSGWQDEPYPIFGSRSSEICIERAGSSLFGLVDYGIHLTAYVERENGLQVWVARRAKDKMTYPGMLDNTVAGGILYGEEPRTTIVREAIEEASLPEDLVQEKIRACGVLSYFHVQGANEGDPTGLFQPSVRFVYDLRLGPDVKPLPADEDIDHYELLSADEIKAALAAGDFRPSSTLVLLDFCIRHGIINSENEKHYSEIIARIHRKLPFPTTSQVIATPKKRPATPKERPVTSKECPTTPSNFKGVEIPSFPSSSEVNPNQEKPNLQKSPSNETTVKASSYNSSRIPNGEPSATVNSRKTQKSPNENVVLTTSSKRLNRLPAKLVMSKTEPTKLDMPKMMPTKLDTLKMESTKLDMPKMIPTKLDTPEMEHKRSNDFLTKEETEKPDIALLKKPKKRQRMR